MATIQRATGRILALHFTLTPAGVRRLAKYYPILPMDRLEEQFIETFQGIPISLSRGQLTRLAGQIGFRGRRPGFLLPPPRDVYAGLPEEFHPSGDDVEPELAPGEHSPLDPLPIFPTSEEVRLMTELLRVSNGHVLVGESPERGHGGDL
jgi:hypothetical protein